MSAKALLPGMFDPPTHGHLDIIKRAAPLFSSLIVAVGENPKKGKPSFTKEERVELLKKIISIPNVEVTFFSGLVVDFAKEKGVSVIIKGVRNHTDFDYEIAQGYMNRKLGNIETLYLASDAAHAMISSSLLKEVAKWGKIPSGFVPKEIESQVYNRLSHA